MSISKRIIFCAVTTASIAAVIVFLACTGQMIRGIVKSKQSPKPHIDNLTPLRAFRSFILALSEKRFDDVARLTTDDGKQVMNENYFFVKTVSDQPYTLSFEEFLIGHGKKLEHIDSLDLGVTTHGDNYATIDTEPYAYHGDSFLFRKIDNRWYLDGWSFEGGIVPPIDVLKKIFDDE